MQIKIICINFVCMKQMLTIGEAAEALGVTTTTMRNWDKKGILCPDERTRGGDRRYRIESLRKMKPTINLDEESTRKTVAYARVSTKEQTMDLVRQVQVLENYCSAKGFQYEVIQDIGSGMNYYKKGLSQLLNRILEGDVHRLVLTHKDRLLRFGAELVFSICEARNVEVIIINKGEENINFEEELAKDVLEIITVFSARLYGRRSNKNKKLLESLDKTVRENVSKK